MDDANSKRDERWKEVTGRLFCVGRTQLGENHFGISVTPSQREAAKSPGAHAMGKKPQATRVEVRAQTLQQHASNDDA